VNILELLLALVAITGITFVAYFLSQNAQLKAKLASYSQITDKESHIARMDADALKRQQDLQAQEASIQRTIEQKLQQLKQQEVTAAQNLKIKTQEVQQVQQEIQALKRNLAKVQEVSFLEEFGFYERRFTYEDSGKYADALNACRERQKKMLKDKQAAVCTTT
jgi:3-phosphoglycerate kinase